MSKTVKLETSKGEAPEFRADVIFKDAVAKDLFMLILSTYSEGIQDLMSKLAPEMKYGEIDPKIVVRGDEIIVDSVASDKGLVLTRAGYQDYKEVAEGEKYSTIHNAKLTVFIKAHTREGVKQADKIVGIAPSVTEAFVDMDEHASESKK